jgi:DNA-binding transcriptional LysR family regulator
MHAGLENDKLDSAVIQRDELVAGGIGIALVPASFQFIQIEGVSCRPLVTPPPVEPLAVWRRDSNSKLRLRFLDILKRLRRHRAD